MCRPAEHTLRPSRCHAVGARTMSHTKSAVLLAALVGQLWPVAAERPEMDLAEAHLEAVPNGEDEVATDSESVTDVAPDSAAAPGPAAALASDESANHAGCPSIFGPLNEKMTVVDLDPNGGCVKGVDSDSARVHFVGGSDDTCEPPTSSSGCHRFIVSRYLDECDLSPLEDSLGQTVSFANPSQSVKAMFGQDGVYTQCDQAGFLQTRTMLYIGGKGFPDGQCNEDLCSGSAALNDDSVATRASSSWACYIVAAALAAWIF